MTAGLEVDVKRCIARQWTGFPESTDLSVRSARTIMVPLTDDPPMTNHNASDQRIGTNLPGSSGCQPEGATHEHSVLCNVRALSSLDPRGDGSYRAQ
jgi:hypothetical protein